jgi:hypothetical protein
MCIENHFLIEKFYNGIFHRQDKARKNKNNVRTKQAVSMHAQFL